MKNYSQKWYSDKLGTCNVTIKSHGCFISCLSMLLEIEPPAVNRTLTKNGGYANGCNLLSEKACGILGLDYSGRTTKDPGTMCIAETNYYANKGIPQHFFVYHKGDMVDPLSQSPEWRDCIYPIVSYRLISNKNDMSDKTYYIKSQLRNELKKIWSKFDHEDPKSHEEMADKLEDYIQDSQLSADHFEEAYNTVQDSVFEINEEVNELKQKVSDITDEAATIIGKLNANLIEVNENNKILEDITISQATKIKELEVYKPVGTPTNDLKFNWTQSKYYISKVWSILINKLNK